MSLRAVECWSNAASRLTQRRTPTKERVFWTTDRESLVGLGFNKNLMRVAEAPRSFADLAKPEYKGKIAVSGDETGVRMIGAMLRAKCEEYVKQLKGLDIMMHMISGGALHELMAAGETPASILIFRNHVLAAQPKGAPTEWVPLDLVVTNAGGIAIPIHTNNPYSALLFADFLISPEGQKIFEDGSDSLLHRKLRLQALVSRKGLTRSSTIRRKTDGRSCFERSFDDNNHHHVKRRLNCQKGRKYNGKLSDSSG